MCQFGAACTRPVCFFAHGDHQLRHTDMPGGPQPVVAPPEPVPSLNGSGFGRDLSSPIDPALKQQQQLMALQAAAAGFSGNQQQGGQQQQHHQHHQRQQQHHAVASGMGMDTLSGSLHHVGSYPSMVGGGVDASSMGGMGGAGGMGMGMGNLQHHSLGGMTSSSPLSAPLPQLSPDMLAALQSMNNGGAGGGSNMSPMGHALMHHHSGIPTSQQYADALPASGRLQRSLTAHPAVNAAAAAAAANENSQNLNELSKQLAFMQLMGSHAAGGPDASGTLADLGAAQSVDTLLLAQLQQQQQHAAAAAAAAAAVTAGLDLSGLLPVTSYGQPADGSLSCPLPPVFGNGALGGHQDVQTSLQQLASAGVLAGASLNLPRVPTAPGSVFSPTSPIGSDTGRDAPSPVGADGRDTQVGGGTAVRREGCACYTRGRGRVGVFSCLSVAALRLLMTLVLPCCVHSMCARAIIRAPATPFVLRGLCVPNCHHHPPAIIVAAAAGATP